MFWRTRLIFPLFKFLTITQKKFSFMSGDLWWIRQLFARNVVGADFVWENWHYPFSLLNLVVGPEILVFCGISKWWARENVVLNIILIQQLGQMQNKYLQNLYWCPKHTQLFFLRYNNSNNTFHKLFLVILTKC